MKATFVKVWIGKNKRDISDKIENLVYEDTTEKDNLVTLTVKSKNALEMTDDKDIVAGAELRFQWGYLSGASSEVHIARLTDIETRYADRVSMTIRGLDNGTNMKKNSGNKVWSKKTSSEIVEEIAKAHKLKYEIEKTSTKHDSIPQGNKTDFEFIQYLATLEGAMRFYIRGDKLFFKKKDLSQKSFITFTYGEGTNLIEFNPKFKESQQTGTSGTVESKGHDPKSGEPVTASVDDKSKQNNTALGSKYYTLASDAYGTTRKIIVAPPAVKPKDDTAKNAANAAKDKADGKGIEASMKCLGIPSFVSDKIVTIAGVAQRHAGNWYVKKVTHNVPAGGEYTCSADLDKNAGKDGQTTADKTNKTQGDKDAKKSNVILARTGDGDVREDNTYKRKG